MASPASGIGAKVEIKWHDNVRYLATVISITGSSLSDWRAKLIFDVDNSEVLSSSLY